MCGTQPWGDPVQLGVLLSAPLAAILPLKTGLTSWLRELTMTCTTETNLSLFGAVHTALTNADRLNRESTVYPSSSI